MKYVYNILVTKDYAIILRDGREVQRYAGRGALIRAKLFVKKLSSGRDVASFVTTRETSGKTKE